MTTPNGEPMQQVLAEIIDLKVKIAPALERLAEHDDRLKDQEARIRVLYDRVPADLQSQLATLFARRYVSPASLGWAVGFAAVCLGTLITFLALKG